MPFHHIDKRPFTMADARRVQRETLARWETVLKPEVYAVVERAVRKASVGITHPFSLPRGQDVDNIVGNLRYKAYHRENIEVTLETGVSFDMPKRAALDMSVPGQSADNACSFWQPKLRNNLEHLTSEEIQRELLSSGGWQAEDLLDRPTNEERLLWLASCNARDNGELEDAKEVLDR